MNKTHILVLLSVMLSTTSLSENDGGGVYRHSWMYEIEYLYVAKQIAIVRSVNYYNSETPEILYKLCRAKWLGEPELASQTGDAEDEKLILNIRSLQWIPENKMLLGKGTDPNMSVGTTVYFILQIDTGKASIFHAEKDFHRYLMDNGLKKFSLVGIELFFRKLVERRNEFSKKRSEKERPPIQATPESGPRKQQTE